MKWIWIVGIPICIFIGLIVLGAVISAVSDNTENGAQEGKQVTIPTDELLAMTSEELASWARKEGFDDEVVGRIVEDFEAKRGELKEWRDQFATPEPHDWTIEELADCVPTPGSKMSDCELEVFSAMSEAAGTVYGRLLREERTIILGHMEYIEAFNDRHAMITEDKVITRDEWERLCFVLPQQVQQAQEAQDYIDSLGRDDLRGLEIDILRQMQLMDSTEETCVQAGLLPAGSVSRISTPEPVKHPELNQEILRTGTEEEILAEHNKHPCFLGKGQWGYIWDTDCLYGSGQE